MYKPKYGDVDRVKSDVIALNEILMRQGTSLFIDVIAESVGNIALKFKLPSLDSSLIRESIIEELNEAILERT